MDIGKITSTYVVKYKIFLKENVLQINNIKSNFALTNDVSATNITELENKKKSNMKLFPFSIFLIVKLPTEIRMILKQNYLGM